MVLAVQREALRSIQPNPLTPVGPRFKRVILRQRERFRDYLEGKRLQPSSASVTILAPAESVLQSVSWRTDLRLTLIKYQRNMQALTEQRLQFPSHRKEWQS